MRTASRSPFHQAVAIELVRAGLDQRRLATQLGVAPTTLSGWLTQTTAAPADLPTRIERALKIPIGTLTAALANSAA